MYIQLLTHIGVLWITHCKSDLIDFSQCHDDFSLQPSDGLLPVNTFSWLGFVQYVHVTTGMHHHTIAPRVVLIQPQFVLITASDALRLPKNYKLGNVVLGEYYRDEEDCGISRADAKLSVHCPRAYMEVPISDINPHPEFSRFGVSNSLALIKLLRPLSSQYTLPICLPTERGRYFLKTNRVAFMVDYISLVPHDFEYERMGKKSLKIYTHKDCKRHRRKMSVGKISITHALCSTGCGMRPGAPILMHSEEGTFELIGLTVGGALCSNRSMRRHLNHDPPVYTDVYPYSSWIINVISAHLLPQAYPQTFMRTSDGTGVGLREGRPALPHQKSGWKARTFVAGNACFESLKSFNRKYTFFYSERFEVNADPPGKMFFFMMFSCGIECTITCARLNLPNRYVSPKIKGIGAYNISIQFSTQWFPYIFYFSLGLWGVNTTSKNIEAWKYERKEGFW